MGGLQWTKTRYIRKVGQYHALGNIYNLTFVALLIFLPSGGSPGLRHVPLWLAIIALIAVILLIKLIMRLCFIHRVFTTMRNSGFKVKIKWNIMAVCIIAEKGEKTYNIVLLYRRYSKARYHFEDAAHIEIYRTIASWHRNGSASGQVLGVVYIESVETKRIAHKKLPRFVAENSSRCLTYFVFNKKPDAVTDSHSKNYLGNGDNICSANIFLYDYCSFKKAITEV